MNKVSKWIIALTVILPTLLEVLDTSVVNVALDHIRGSLSAGVDEATWTITAYLVSNAIIIPLTGWLSSVFGRKRYLLFSVVLFTFSSFLCGSARSLSALIFFRILQGVGGGALQPISQSILFEAFPPAQYGIAMAIFGIGVMFGPIAGPVLGGWIADNWSWPWIFYVNIPIGILSVLMIKLFIQDPHYLKRINIKEKLDRWGIALVIVGIGCLQVVLDKGQREDWFSSNFIVALAVIAVVSLVAFVINELRTPEPVLHLRVFKDTSFASANIIQAGAFGVMYAGIVLLPLFLQQLMGYNAFLAGMALMPGGIGTIIAMVFVGQLMVKTSPKFILGCGIGIVTYSIFLMARFNLYIDYNSIAWARIVMGVGLGMLFVPLASLAFSTIKKEEMGNATSIFSLLRNIAGSVGIALITTLLARRAQFHQLRLTESLNPFDPRYQAAMQQASSILNAKAGTASPAAANGLIYQELMKQSSLLSFTDAFYISAVAMICVLPLVFLLKRPKDGAAAAAVH